MDRPSATFASKVDAWLAAVLLGSALSVAVAVATAWRSPSTAMAALLIMTLAVGTGLPLWLLAATRYRVEGDELLIRSGPMRWRIAVDDIRSIEPTRNWLSSPALSLDRLRIHYGRAGQVMVSPRDKEAFVQALLRRNPRIRAC